MADTVSLLVFRKDTGEILNRVDHSSFAAQNALALNLTVSCKSFGTLTILLDGKQESFMCTRGSRTFRANQTIRVETHEEGMISGSSFLLNGQPYNPAWNKDEDRIGSYKYLKSASFQVMKP